MKIRGKELPRGNYWLQLCYFLVVSGTWGALDHPVVMVSRSSDPLLCTMTDKGLCLQTNVFDILDLADIMVWGLPREIISSVQTGCHRYMNSPWLWPSSGSSCPVSQITDIAEWQNSARMTSVSPDLYSTQFVRSYFSWQNETLPRA